jgi:hypothetical protein
MASWNDGATKKCILNFVARVTQEGGPDYIRQKERIPTFDNDGTLWSERPYPFQRAFALDQVKARHPSTLNDRGKSPLDRCWQRTSRGYGGRIHSAY